ncbi:hypothetical protein PH562_18875 [Rhizobium sp. CNPSo 4062]|uniref:hypothetical protein n=1 Tax=Rhizobium sp. CNPSo 4062 TaxID=3021410 RepID=UPI00254A68D5|nr:hypothetical protein [Rhizobium sp. CNPSo 4062]MDK4704324.1 hypothetical protein [Rhizobium sp. CNPSo 4062]
MSKILKYDVLREHEGDRFYKRGETRELAENDAQHLVGLGVLALPGSARKQPTASDAKTKADIEAEFNLFVDTANQTRQAISTELNKAREAADAKLSEIGVELAAARNNADATLASIASELTAARKDADVKIGEIAAEIEKAKSEASRKTKPEEQPSNKAEQTPEKNK